MSCNASGVRLDEFATTLRMAMFSSDAHPGPIDLNLRALSVLPFVFHTHSADIGPILHVTSEYTCPESASNFFNESLLVSDASYSELARILSLLDIFYMLYSDSADAIELS